MVSYLELRDEVILDLGPAYGFYVGPWHKWFAWKPVTTFDGRFVWLRSVWRRRCQEHEYLRSGLAQWWWYSLYKPKAKESHNE